MDINAPVIFGKDKWLFYPSSIAGDWLADRSLSPFSESQLDAWQSLYEKRNKFFAEHGIPFLLVVVPDKQSIYPEFVPDHLSALARIPGSTSSSIACAKRIHRSICSIFARSSSKLVNSGRFISGRMTIGTTTEPTRLIFRSSAQCKACFPDGR